MNELAGDYQRTHVYAEVDHANPKHLFRVIGDRIAATLGDKSQPRLLDVGGASGALAGYLKHRFADSTVTCLDYDPALCAAGRARLPNVHFITGDANDMDMLGDRSFDVVSMVGTMGIFDDFAPSLNECIRLAAPGGMVIVAGQFNDHPVDALIRYRYSGEDRWNTGYNLFSKKTVGRHLDQHPRVARHAFEDFELPFDLQPQADPVRTWTEVGCDGRRELRNGLNLVVDLKLLEINLSEH